MSIPNNALESSRSNLIGAHVLLVEDDDLQREGMAHWLRAAGLVVDECSSVKLGWAKYQNHAFDVIVTDLRLQDGTGLELIQHARQKDPLVSAVVVTHYADMATAIASLREGATDFLVKPLNPEVLRAAVQRALGIRALRGENVQLRLALEERMLQLQHANEQLQAFTGRVAHDLRAPIRSTRLWAQLATEALEGGDIKEAAKYLSSTIKSIGAGTAIIDSLLAFSKSDALQLKTEGFSLDPVVEAVIESCRLEFSDRTFDVTTEVSGKVEADPVLLGIALTNLIHNAFKYSSRQNAPMLHIVAGPVGSSYRITVQDNGVGVDPALKHQLFRPFARLHTARDFNGEGLGLLTVKKIIERHGGTIRLDSSEGSGTTITVDLPRPDN